MDSNSHQKSASGRRCASPIGGQRKKHRTVRQFGPTDHIFDAVEQDRPGGLKQYLLVVGVELAHREAAAAG
jgi:hypothetical protein